GAEGHGGSRVGAALDAGLGGVAGTVVGVLRRHLGARAQLLAVPAVGYGQADAAQRVGDRTALDAGRLAPVRARPLPVGATRSPVLLPVARRTLPVSGALRRRRAAAPVVVGEHPHADADARQQR